jgi:hypothetical protein
MKNESKTCLGRLVAKESFSKFKAPARLAGACNMKRKWKTIEAACALDTSPKLRKTQSALNV